MTRIQEKPIIHAIMSLADGPGDRWLALSGRMADKGEREESPDTVVVGSQEPVTKYS